MNNRMTLIDLKDEKKKLSITLTCSIKNGGSSPAKVFYFFQHLDKYYLDISQGHKKFELQNGATSLETGGSIENEEMAGGQYVKHRYEVVEFTKDRSIKLFSDSSMVTLWGGLVSVPVSTTVAFTIGETDVSSTLTLQFKNRLSFFAADLMGTRNIWKGHVEEEMTNATNLIKSEKFSNDYDNAISGEL